MKPEEILALIGIAKEYAPVVEGLVPVIMDMGKEVKPMLEALVDSTVDLTDRSIKRYIDKGYTKEQAIDLATWNKQSVLSTLQRSRTK